MGVLTYVKLRWFVLGFLTAQEGWNGETPFAISSPAEERKPVDEMLKEFYERLKSKDNSIRGSAKAVIEVFDELIEEERKNMDKVKEIARKIAKEVKL